MEPIEALVALREFARSDPLPPEGATDIFACTCGGPLALPADVRQLPNGDLVTAHPENIRRVHAVDCKKG